MQIVNKFPFGKILHGRFINKYSQVRSKPKYADNIITKSTFFADISFTSIANKRCMGTYHGNIYSTSGNHDNCKQWCVVRSDCGGFTVSGSKCDFKVCDSLIDLSGQTTFRKTVN